MDFLDWDEPDDDQFAQNVRIVLASAEFSKELASSVPWLIDQGIDLSCVRLKPYSHAGGWGAPSPDWRSTRLGLATGLSEGAPRWTGYPHPSGLARR
jgi:hypothetical protein